MPRPQAVAAIDWQQREREREMERRHRHVPHRLTASDGLGHGNHTCRMAMHVRGGQSVAAHRGFINGRPAAGG